MDKVVALVDMERAFVPPQHFIRLVQRRLNRQRREEEMKNRVSERHPAQAGNSSGSEVLQSENGNGTSMREAHGAYGMPGSEVTSIAHVFSASSLRVDDYQDLLDRGWRRSGTFLYKPEMKRTCYPSYTIRLKVDAFVPTKEQKRVQRRIQRYLDGTYDGSRTVGVSFDVCRSLTELNV